MVIENAVYAGCHGTSREIQGMSFFAVTIRYCIKTRQLLNNQHSGNIMKANEMRCRRATERLFPDRCRVDAKQNQQCVTASAEIL